MHLNLSQLKIFCTVFLLWATTQLNSYFENYIALFLILTFGLLHGANDINLIKKNNYKKFNYKKTIANYLLSIIVGFILFIFSSKIMILLFIIMSSFHFGEQHFSKSTIKKNKQVYFFYALYGLIVFLLLFSTHKDEVLIILEKVNINSIDLNIINYALILCLLIIFILYIKIKANKLIKINLYQELFLLILFLIIFKNATLLWSFSIYFIFWHSLPSLNDQVFMLYGETSKQSITKYIKSSFLYWFISVIGVIAIGVFFHDNEQQFYFISIAIIFSITCPHIFIISKIKR